MKSCTVEEQTTATIAFAAGAGQPGDSFSGDRAKVVTECWSCMHARSVPGESHILCASPDMSMTMSAHGLANGWALYPLLFDPVWKMRRCRNYERHGS